MDQAPRLLLPSGQEVQPVGDSPRERFNAIIRVLSASRLQRGEARVDGIYLAIGSLCDLTRDLFYEVAGKQNELVGAVEALTLAFDAQEQRIAELEAVAAIEPRVAALKAERDQLRRQAKTADLAARGVVNNRITEISQAIRQLLKHGAGGDLPPLALVEDRTPEQITADGDATWPDGSPYNACQH